MGVIYIVLLAGSVLGILIHQSILSRLRDQHPEAWQSLGSPSFLSNYSIKTNGRVRKFLKSEECRELRDAVLADRIANERRFGLAYALILISVVIGSILF